MENNNNIEIGYLEITSWEHLAATGLRYCYGVEQLEWDLPAETMNPLKNLLGLWQEVLLQDCILLSPLVDGGSPKRKIYLKSTSFKKRLTKDSLDLFKQLPVARLYLNAMDVYFAHFIRHGSFNFGQILDWDIFKLEPIPKWDDYVLENSGYLTGCSHGKGTKFWVPNSNDNLTQYYGVSWRTHDLQDDILGQIFGEALPD